MAKLFAFEEDTVARPATTVTEPTPMDEQLYAIEMASESMVMANTQLDILNAIKANLSDERGSMQVGMEHFAPIIESIAANFGVRSNLPSLEAYSDKYASSAAKDIALESIGGFFKAIWDRLVGFVKALFNAFRGLIMGFKGNEAKKLAKMDDISEVIEKLIADKASLSDTKKINTVLPSLLSDVGETEFTATALLVQSSSRIAAFVSMVDVINQNDSNATAAVKDKLTISYNMLENEYKHVADTYGRCLDVSKQDLNSDDKIDLIIKLLDQYTDTSSRVEPIEVIYFPATVLDFIEEKEIPVDILASIKNNPGYKSCAVKKLRGPTALKNYMVYVAHVITDNEAAKPANYLRVSATANLKAPSSLDPIGSLEELKKLAQEVKGLCRAPLTVDAKRIGEIYNTLVDNIRDVSVKFDEVNTSMNALFVKLQKERAAANSASGLLAAMAVESNDSELLPEFVNIKRYIKNTQDANTVIRNSILGSAKELTTLNTSILSVKNETVEAYIQYFTATIAKYN